MSRFGDVEEGIGVTEYKHMLLKIFMLFFILEEEKLS